MHTIYSFEILFQSYEFLQLANNFWAIFFLKWANQNVFAAIFPAIFATSIFATSRALVCLNQEVTCIVDTSGL